MNYESLSFSKQTSHETTVPIDETPLPSRLSRIGTQWTLLREAHEDSQQALEAQSSLMLHYQGAIRRYLRGCLRDGEAAEEVFQEFALRLLRGEFRRVDPAKGRFRDYLRTVLSRMVHEYRRKRQRQGVNVDPQICEVADAAGSDESAEAFEESWRAELLDRAWRALREYEQRTGRPYYQLLRYRSEHPRENSEQMAAALSAQLDPPRPLTAAGVRKTLQRARAEYAARLVEEVAASLGSESPEEIDAELADLQLLAYCQDYLQK